MNGSTANKSRDWARQPIGKIVWWGIPILVAVLAGSARLPIRTAAFVLAGAFAWMGTGCVLNSLRCHRLHCYISGPVLLIGAAAVALIGFGALNEHALNVVVWSAAAIVLVSHVPEAIWGMYRAH